MKDVTTLYKPLSPTQLVAVIDSGWRGFSPDTPQQRIFYPKLSRQYAETIARQWDAPQFTAGYVVEFKICSEFIQRFELQTVAYAEHREYKVPITALAQLNKNICGGIHLVSAFTINENLIWRHLKERKCVGFH